MIIIKLCINKTRRNLLPQYCHISLKNIELQNGVKLFTMFIFIKTQLVYYKSNTHDNAYASNKIISFLHLKCGGKWVCL